MGVTAAGITGGDPREMTVAARTITEHRYGIAPTTESVHPGAATDAWSAYMAFNWVSLYVLLECWTNPLDVQLSDDDGVSYKPVKEVTAGSPLLIPFTATGCRVRNAVSGSNSRYEITALGTGF